MATSILLIIINFFLSLFICVEGVVMIRMGKRRLPAVWLEFGLVVIALCWALIFAYLFYLEVTGVTVAGLGGAVDKVLVTLNRPLMTLTLALMAGQLVIVKKG